MNARRIVIWIALGLPLAVYAPLAADEPPPAQPAPDYAAMLRELKPRMMLDFTEQNLNAYLRAHPEDFAIPEGFDSPAVALREGIIEVSALARLLFVATRVRVEMVPEVARGKLRLRVHKVKAGPIPLPPGFHRGTADTIESVINQILGTNDMELLCVEIVPNLVRVTAQVRAAEPTPARQ